VVSAGTQLRLLDPVHNSVGAGVVTSTGGSVVSGTQLRLLDPVQTSVGAGVVTSTGGEQLRLLVPSQTVGSEVVGAGVVTSTGGEQLRLLVPSQAVGAGVVTSTGGSVVGIQLRLLEPEQTSTGAEVVVAGTQLRLLEPEQTSTGAEVVVSVVLLIFSAEQKAMIAKIAKTKRIVRIVVMMLCCFVVLLHCYVVREYAFISSSVL
jgi:hypothetical protein